MKSPAEDSTEVPAGPVPGALVEVKYSLPDMLGELKTERAASSFAMEKLDQGEIGKLFKGQRKPRRAKPKD